MAERCGVEGDLAGPAVCIFNEPRDTVPYTQACTDPMHSASQPHTDVHVPRALGRLCTYYHIWTYNLRFYSLLVALGVIERVPGALVTGGVEGISCQEHAGGR